MSININPEVFHRRLLALQARLQHPEAGAPRSLLLLVGASDDENTYKKTTVAQTWLTGYELALTAIAVLAGHCIIVTGEKSAKHFQRLTAKPTANASTVEVWPRVRLDPDANHALLARLQLVLVGPVGHVTKDHYQGKFVEEWRASVGATEFVDCLVLLLECLAVKDAEELALVRLAAALLAVMMDVFTDEMVAAVEGDAVTNLQLLDRLEAKIDGDKWHKRPSGKRLLGADFDPELLDWCYLPIVQSGGEYDIRPLAQLTRKRVAGEGIILALVGLRYRLYCANVSRTFLIDPTPQMERQYDALVRLQQHVADEELRAGATASEVYAQAVAWLEREEPELAGQFAKNCGWVIGIEFRDLAFVLNAKSERRLEAGMCVALSVGVQGANAMLLADTFVVGLGCAEWLTPHSRARLEVSFFFKEDAPAAAPKAEKPVVKLKLRHEAADDNSGEKARQEAQRRLHEKRQQEGLARFLRADASDALEYRPRFKKYELYARELQIPALVRDLKVHVDYKAQTVLVPICGRPVPFHINAFKNGLQNEEGDFTYLRLNFNLPGMGGVKRAHAELAYEDHPEFAFLRLVTLRLRDRQRMADVFKAIQDLKRDAVKRELERKQMADVVTQALLVELKGLRMKKLEQVFVRPQPDTKKVGGVLQIHANGLRYQLALRTDQRVDVLFSNIKHLFFQPCKDELIVVIHCHLKTPIMIGKKKTFDVQFYREALDIAFDETGGRKRKYRYGDEDELQQEQEERRRKALLDKEFRGFAELIADLLQGAVDLDVPFRELGFQGVPFRLAVLCMPTRDCLVQLIDPPYLVITLEEIEIAHLERVQFGLKNFDLVFVFKDFSKPVVHINTIPIEVLEDVKSWLTDVDIPLSEGQMNLNWATIMKTVQLDPYQFFLDGGWVFLTGDGTLDDEEEEEEELEFEVSDVDPSDEDVELEAALESDYGSESGSGSGSEDESEGEDWDEMEKKAAREDQQRR